MSSTQFFDKLCGYGGVMADRSPLLSWGLVKNLLLILGSSFFTGIALIWLWPVEAGQSQPRPPAQALGGISVSQNPTSAPSGPSIQVLQNQFDALKAESANQEKAIAIEREEISHLNEVPRLLMTVAGVFALVLGAASWKSLDDQRKLARETQDSQKATFDAELKAFLSSANNLLNETLNKSKESLRQTEQLRDEVERDFPMFGRMGGNFARILTGLTGACSKLQMDDKTYSGLSWEEEQRILFYESAISTSLLLHTESRSKELSEIYRLLGVFYGSKFCSALPDGKISDNSDRRDFNRARFYFDRSIAIDDKNYLAYLSAGYFTQYNDDQSIALVSRDYFEGAAVAGPQYQKPWVSIALIELDALRNPDKALAALDEALKRPKYDVLRSKHAEGYIEYVKACAYCLKAKKDSSKENETLLGKAMESLRQAFEHNNQYVREAFAKERKEYFDILEDSPTFRTQFAILIEKLENPEGASDSSDHGRTTQDPNHTVS
jgi:tetratricopeptide (TPR) repeat protein